MTRRALACWVLAVALPGCALLSRGEALAVRYFDPAPPLARAATQPSPGCELALGRVSRAEDVREEILYRTSPYEASYYDSRRWTETPDNYLRRTLERALFDQNRCRRVLSPGGATLDVSLVAFDELRDPEAAHVVVSVLLHDDDSVLYQGTLEATRRVASGTDSFEPVARAMGEALSAVTSQVTRAVEDSLVREAASSARLHP
jgi:cholesterol transport system auxiliary component